MSSLSHMAGQHGDNTSRGIFAPLPVRLTADEHRLSFRYYFLARVVYGIPSFLKVLVGSVVVFFFAPSGAQQRDVSDFGG